MVYASFSPAITAGLLDALCVGLPLEARGVCADAFAEAAITLPSSDFLMGSAAGMCACGVVALAVGVVVSLRSRRNQAPEAARDHEKDDTSALSVKAMHLQATRSDAQVEAQLATHQAKHNEAQQGAHQEERTKVQRKARKHAKDSGEVVLRKAQPAAAHTQKKAQSSITVPAHAQQKAALNSERAPEAATTGRHTAGDYADIATNYVSRRQWSERKKSRTRGVRQLLAERMGAGMLEDMPVIMRGDGSVGDVGTGWWEAALGNSMRHDFSNLPEMNDIDMTGVHNTLVSQAPAASATPAQTQHRVTQRPSQRPQVAQSSSQPSHAPQSSDAHVGTHTREQAILAPKLSEPISRVAHLNLSNADRALYIAKHVALVDEGAFPERREFNELEHEDLWAKAMAAMDARANDPAALAEMGALDSDLDHPVHDQPTAVLPFRPVAGHPEVVDKASYVDYLLRQEFEQNSSAAVRRTSRSYLKLLDGGSTSSYPTSFNIRTQSQKSKPKHAARHMAPQEDGYELPLAQQA